MDVGGIENQLMHLMRKCDKSKFQVDFTTTMDHPFYEEEIKKLGGKLHHIPRMSRVNPFPYCAALYRIMRDGKYDVVHSHELFHSGVVLPVAALAGVPARFVHAHNWSDDDGTGRKRSVIRTIYNSVMRFFIRQFSTCQLACSTLAGKFLYGEDIVNKPTYHLVFNSVDTEKYLNQFDVTESGEFCNDGWTNVIQVGRFSEVKNQLFTAQIARELKNRGRKIRILCAGNNGNDYELRVRESIENLGIQEHMLLLGVRSDIDVLMRKSAAFLLPSLYEGMPLVLIEAQASGLPCVAADTFSHEVDFELGKVSWLNLDEGVKAWADAVELAVASGRASKNDVVRVVNQKRFDSTMFAQRLCELYENAVGNKI